MKKRFVSLLVVVCMLLTLFPVSAFADNAKSGEFHTDGIKTQDGNFVYSVNDDDTATYNTLARKMCLRQIIMKLIFLPSLTDIL